MNEDDLDRMLREWGALSKYEAERGSGATDFHVLSRALDFAPGTRARAAQRLVGRDGRGRRTMMAASINAELPRGGSVGFRILPPHFVDPVRGHDTRKVGPHERIGDSIPAHLKLLHAAALELYRVDTTRGLVLRQEYCGYGSQMEKSERVSVACGCRIGLRMYREALAHARGWMMAKLA